MIICPTTHSCRVLTFSPRMHLANHFHPFTFFSYLSTHTHVLLLTSFLVAATYGIIPRPDVEPDRTMVYSMHEATRPDQVVPFVHVHTYSSVFFVHVMIMYPLALLKVAGMKIRKMRHPLVLLKSARNEDKKNLSMHKNPTCRTEHFYPPDVE